MDIGIGLPGHAPWTDGRALVQWARRAEAHGFSTLSVSDRLVWTTPEPLVTLAAAAGATERIGLLTSVLLAPLRADHALFAKAVTTLDRLAGPGRLSLGLAPGIREDDFTAGGVDYGSRGRAFDDLLDRLAEIAGPDSADPVGPRSATSGGPPVLFGGFSQKAVHRVAARGAGWIGGDATPEGMAEFGAVVRKAWDEAGRPGEPRLVASVMFALGPDADASVASAIGPYYAFAGEEYVEYGLSSAHTDPGRIREAVAEFAAAGVDELLFTGNDPDPAQVDLLADALGL